MSTEAKCPFTGGTHHIGMGKGPRNLDWWPNALDVGALHAHSPKGNPLGDDFDYRKEFLKLDLQEGK